MRWFIEIEMSFAFGASATTSSYIRPGCPSSGPCTVWQNGTSTSPPSASPSRPVWSCTTSNSSALADRVHGVLHLPVRVADPLARRRLEDRLEPGARLRVAGGEERDVVAGVDEAVREQRDDALGPAVRLGRDGEPDGADDADPHQTLPSADRYTPALDRSRPRAAERADALDAQPVEPARQLVGRRSRRAAGGRGRARSRAGRGRAGSACRRPRPAAARRSDTRSGTASRRARSRRRPRAATSRSGPRPRSARGRRAARPRA